MAMFDFTITEANVGQTIGPENGFVTRLVRDRAPIYETPTFDEGRQVWTRGYLQLRGSRDVRDLVCYDAANPLWGALWRPITVLALAASWSSPPFRADRSGD